MPAEPPPTRWALPPAHDADEHGVVGIGADLEPGTLLAAYRSGLFPMPLAGSDVIAWWSPDPRGIIPLDRPHVSRSLRRSRRRFEPRVDTAFEEVIDGCRDPKRPGGWISPAVRDAYVELHRLGWAHSVESWTQQGELAGGLYGVAIGGFFAGESMFHRVTDASKAAVVWLVQRLHGAGAALFDVQWTTEHLASLGAVDVPRQEYLARLAEAIEMPLPPFLDGVAERGGERPGPRGRGT